jgi:hypothetical protein
VGFVSCNESFVVVLMVIFLDFLVGALSLLHLVCIGVVSCYALYEVLFASLGVTTSLAMTSIGILVALDTLGGLSFMPTCLEDNRAR